VLDSSPSPPDSGFGHPSVWKQLLHILACEEVWATTYRTRLCQLGRERLLDDGDQASKADNSLCSSDSAKTLDGQSSLPDGKLSSQALLILSQSFVADLRDLHADVSPIGAPRRITDCASFPDQFSKARLCRDHSPRLIQTHSGYRPPWDNCHTGRSLCSSPDQYASPGFRPW
jgi:hypothetical protein